jgi:hypothetical protein
VVVDDFGLIETVDHLDESIVIAVADTADRRRDTALNQIIRVLD